MVSKEGTELEGSVSLGKMAASKGTDDLRTADVLSLIQNLFSTLNSFSVVSYSGF